MTDHPSPELRERIRSGRSSLQSKALLAALEEAERERDALQARLDQVARPKPIHRKLAEAWAVLNKAGIHGLPVGRGGDLAHNIELLVGRLRHAEDLLDAYRAGQPTCDACAMPNGKHETWCPA